MMFYSTNNKEARVTLEEAIMRGLSEDGGLYMPVQLPLMPGSFFKKIDSLTFKQIAFEVSKMLLENTIPSQVLEEIVDRAINFDAPLKALSPEIYVLELFHGPTLSFKDFGARFMAQLMSYFVRKTNKTLHILVATSGDTGSAIASAFFKTPGIHVWILYPKAKISESQEKQFTTMGENITALEIDGTFDDCQHLVKLAFSDKNLRKTHHLTSANSINIARLIPQIFYYFYAYAQLKEENPVMCSVPCGNFGNLSAGIIAKKMGLPISGFIAATNSNDIVPYYLKSGIFQPKPSKQTLSNAMDVGNPSNFARMLDIYQNKLQEMQKDLVGISFDDNQTAAGIHEIFAKFGYIADPHSAIAYLGLKDYMVQHARPLKGIFLATASAAKFAEEVGRILNQTITIPERLQEVLVKEKQIISLPNDYDVFKDALYS